jgi:hypothetical protein
MMDDSPDTPPEVTIEPADNGFIVRHHQRGTKKDESGRTIRRLAMTTDEALGHAKSALGGSSRSKSKKKSSRPSDGAPSGAITEHAMHSAAAHPSRDRARRRRPRASGRR